MSVFYHRAVVDGYDQINDREGRIPLRPQFFPGKGAWGLA